MSTAQYPVRVREPLSANESAPMPFKVSRACRFLDVIDLPPNVAVTAARLGRVRYSREEMRSSFAEFLALEPQEVKAGTYCVFTVTNLGSKPAEVAGKVLVEAEHGEAVPGLPLREATEEDALPPPMTREASGRNPANDAMVDAIIDNTTMADGTPVAKAKAKNKSKTASSAGAAARRPMPAPAVVPVARSTKSQKIMTRHARRKHYEAEASARAASSVAADTRVVLLHVGHVAMLDLALSACVPLAEGVREEIGAALRDASEGVKTDGVGVVAIHLADEDCERLLEAIDARVEYTLDATDEMRAAVKAALEGPKVDAVSASSSEVTAIAETAAPISAPVSASAAARPLATGEASVEPVEEEVGNVTPISTSGPRSGEKRGDSLSSIGKVQDDGRPQSRPGALQKSVVNEV